MRREGMPWFADGDRLAYVLMTWDVVLAAAGSHERIMSNLPSDAKVHHIVLLHDTRQAQVFFVSETLEPVSEGGLIPQYDVRAREQDGSETEHGYRAVAQPHGDRTAL